MKYQTQIISHFNSIKHTPDYKSYQIYSDKIGAVNYFIGLSDIFDSQANLAECISVIKKVIAGQLEYTGIDINIDIHDVPHEFLSISQDWVTIGGQYENEQDNKDVKL
ncbi:MAG: hypothetical protein H7196_05310, partial [candidate division SR1 bacterium]|nr:hypothetical protein [candidate division SR1 bacterium]